MSSGEPPAIGLWNSLSLRERIAVFSFVFAKVTAFTGVILMFVGLKLAAKVLLASSAVGILMAVVLALVELAVKHRRETARLDHEAIKRLMKSGELDILLEELQKAKKITLTEDKQKKHTDDDDHGDHWDGLRF